MDTSRTTLSSYRIAGKLRSPPWRKLLPQLDYLTFCIELYHPLELLRTHHESSTDHPELAACCPSFPPPTSRKGCSSLQSFLSLASLSHSRFFHTDRRPLILAAMRVVSAVAAGLSALSFVNASPATHSKSKSHKTKDRHAFDDEEYESTLT